MVVVGVLPFHWSRLPAAAGSFAAAADVITWGAWDLRSPLCHPRCVEILFWVHGLIAVRQLPCGLGHLPELPAHYLPRRAARGTGTATALRKRRDYGRRVPRLLPRIRVNPDN
jgi:hypothetical protein